MIDEGMNPGADNPSGGPTGQQGGTTPTGAPAQAPFQSKGEQFDAVKGYQEAQKKIAQQGQELAAFRDILGKVGVYFEMDKDKNEIRLNRDLISKVAKAESWDGFTGNNAQNQAPPNGNHPNEDEPSPFDSEQAAYLKKLVEGAFKERFSSFENEQFKPFRQEWETRKHEGWISELEKKYPDFGNMRSEIGQAIMQGGINVRGPEDLELLYHGIKAKKGGYVDKKQQDEMMKELESTLSTVMPSLAARRNNPDLTNAELLGLDMPETESSRVAQALFGKTIFRDD